MKVIHFPIQITPDAHKQTLSDRPHLQVLRRLLNSELPASVLIPAPLLGQTAVAAPINPQVQFSPVSPDKTPPLHNAALHSQSQQGCKFVTPSKAYAIGHLSRVLEPSHETPKSTLTDVEHLMPGSLMRQVYNRSL